MTDREPARAFVHQVNNFLGVVQTQVAVADALGTPEAARAALDQIRRDADRLASEVQAFRRQAEASSDQREQVDPKERAGNDASGADPDQASS